MTLKELEDLAVRAGDAIMTLYKGHSLGTRHKADSSPVTEADLAAHAIIIAGLPSIEDLPYISEEEAPRVHTQLPKRYWLIDPLDGTKEFIAERDEFTVNIALIEDGVPTHGVVYAPALGELYSGGPEGFRYNRVLQTLSPWPAGRILLSSHSHPEPELRDYIQRWPVTGLERVGSSLKFCRIAIRRAHVYPRFHALSAWDTAAGDAVARAAGCRVTTWKDGHAPVYAYDEPLCPAFCISDPTQP